MWCAAVCPTKERAQLGAQCLAGGTYLPQSIRNPKPSLYDNEVTGDLNLSPSNDTPCCTYYETTRLHACDQEMMLPTWWLSAGRNELTLMSGVGRRVIDLDLTRGCTNLGPEGEPISPKLAHSYSR